MKIRLICIFSSCILFLFSCASSKKNTPHQSNENSIIEKYWKLTEVYEKQVVTDYNTNKEPHFILKKDGNRIHGNGGCNVFNGEYHHTKWNTLSFSKVVATLMACNNMETEGQFFKALNETNHYHFSNDTLILYNTQSLPVIKCVAVYF